MTAATIARRKAKLDEDALDRVFGALANRTRREILDILADRPGTPVGEVAECFDVSRIAIVKHIAALEEAQLVIGERHGRERRLWFNPVPLRLVHERWSERYREFWARRLVSLKVASESEGNDG